MSTQSDPERIFEASLMRHLLIAQAESLPLLTELPEISELLLNQQLPDMTQQQLRELTQHPQEERTQQQEEPTQQPGQLSQQPVSHHEASRATSVVGGSVVEALAYLIGAAQDATQLELDLDVDLERPSLRDQDPSGALNTRPGAVGTLVIGEQDVVIDAELDLEFEASEEGGAATVGLRLEGVLTGPSQPPQRGLGERCFLQSVVALRHHVAVMLMMLQK